jgi:hypothetical protein
VYVAGLRGRKLVVEVRCSKSKILAFVCQECAARVTCEAESPDFPSPYKNYNGVVR